MYFYILYPNGLSHQNEIVNILKTKFNVFKTIQLKIQNKDLNEFFFEHLYKGENKVHIYHKLQYLTPFFIQNNFEMKIILLNDTNEVFFDDRGTKKNLNIETVKREIRNKYNPKYKDINKQVFPLNKGVSHNHVIHSSDVPEEYHIIKNIIFRYKKYNIFKVDNYHHKNDFFLKYFINKHHNNVKNIKDADIILSASKYLSGTENFPNKKFIFGPHFGKDRINEMRKINNINNNNIYIHPSLPSVKLWTDELKYNTMPVKAIPFGVDTNKFKPKKQEKTSVLVYYKHRDPDELKLIETFLKKNNVNYKVFSYLKRYNEKDFIDYLNKCKYGIWVGCHESQGFALQETLSMNVPLLVWSVTQRHQQWPYKNMFIKYKTNVTTIPYWDKNCGEFFYNKNELENKYEEFISKLNTYKPRDFVINNISLEKCCEKWNNLFIEL